MKSGWEEGPQLKAPWIHIKNNSFCQKYYFSNYVQRPWYLASFKLFDARCVSVSKQRPKQGPDSKLVWSWVPYCTEQFTWTYKNPGITWCSCQYDQQMNLQPPFLLRDDLPSYQMEWFFENLREGGVIINLKICVAECRFPTIFRLHLITKYKTMKNANVNTFFPEMQHILPKEGAGGGQGQFWIFPKFVAFGRGGRPIGVFALHHLSEQLILEEGFDTPSDKCLTTLTSLSLLEECRQGLSMTIQKTNGILRMQLLG